MGSLLLGLTAAVAWGIHDICVRQIGQRTGILSAILTVFASGAVLVLPFALIWGNWGALSVSALLLSLGSGATFVLAAIGLYRSFAIGPVRLVAPIVAAYPILSVAWAALHGTAVPVGHWLAVFAIVAGVAIVAILSDEGKGTADRRSAILWAATAGVGFAATFALGQAATLGGAELPVILITRVVAVGGVALVALAARDALRPARAAVPMLLVMGFLDAVALGAVMAAGALPNPEFAAVASSTFGIITIMLAWLILKERMTARQWFGVMVVFAAIAWLGQQAGAA